MSADCSHSPRLGSRCDGLKLPARAPPFTAHSRVTGACCHCCLTTHRVRIRRHAINTAGQWEPPRAAAALAQGPCAWRGSSAWQQRLSRSLCGIGGPAWGLWHAVEPHIAPATCLSPCPGGIWHQTPAKHALCCSSPKTIRKGDSASPGCCWGPGHPGDPAKPSSTSHAAHDATPLHRRALTAASAAAAPAPAS